ncbi:MAG: hypothetical protein WBB37_04820 [bacterium]
MKKIILFIMLLALIINLSYRIDTTRTTHEIIGELMYFPSGRALRIFSMGFYAPLADLIWLRFIQYYGEHRLTDTKFEMMYHILDILTTLDIHFTYAYTLGGLMLTHDAQRPDQARKLLKKGMRAMPDDWRIPFMYGFIHYVFLREHRIAQRYFRIASQKPDAPDVPKRWAAFVTYYRLGDLKTALTLWLDLYNNTKNSEEKAIAEKYIKKIKMKLDIEFLNNKILEFTKQVGRKPFRLEELVIYGIVDSIPTEPHGCHYLLRNGEVCSTFQTD